MANFEIRFNCKAVQGDYMKVEVCEAHIIITSFIDGLESDVLFDKSTAIKFAKTLRTEINKIQD